MRMDTHGDNIVMQALLRKLGFVHCGTIYVEEDDYPRLAFEKPSAHEFVILETYFHRFSQIRRLL